MYFVKWKATFHQDLKHHLDNARYTSPQIQNEIIQLTEDLGMDPKVMESHGR